MKTIQEKIATLKEQHHSKLTAESTAEEIKADEDFAKALDDIEQDYNQVVKDKQEVTDLYIKATKGQGSKTPPKEEKQEPRSLEEIGQAILEQDKKQ